MTKITKIVNSPLFKFFSSILGFVLAGLITIIIYQGAARLDAGELATHDNKIAITKNYEKNEGKFDKKVNNKTLLDYMERNKIEHERLNDRIEKNEMRQEKTNNKLIETLHEIKIEMARDK